MKKLIAIALLAASSTVMAQHHGYRHYHHRPHVVHHHHGHSHWIAPLIIGGVVGAVIASNRVEAQTQVPITTVPSSTIIYSNSTTLYTDQGQQIVTCPQGLYPFEFRGYVRNHLNQFVETTYIKCQ